MISVMRLNHPETISQPQSVEKLPSAKLVPDARKVGEPLHRGPLETQSMSITAENPVGEPWSRAWCFISDLSFQCHASPSPQYHGLHFPTEILGLGWEYRDFLLKLLLSSCLCSSISSIPSLWPPTPAHGWDSGASQGSVAIHDRLHAIHTLQPWPCAVDMAEDYQRWVAWPRGDSRSHKPLSSRGPPAACVLALAGERVRAGACGGPLPS